MKNKISLFKINGSLVSKTVFDKQTKKKFKIITTAFENETEQEIEAE